MKTLLIKILFFILLVIVVCGFMAVNLLITPSGNYSNSFYSHFIAAGGPVVWFLLLPMSIITIYLAFDLAISIRRKHISPVNIVNEISLLIKSNPDQQWLVKVNRKSDFVSTSVLKIMHQTHASKNEIDRLLFENIEQQAMKVLRKIEWANIIGNVSPMIGLFGTVFGMIKAFNGIVVAGGQPQPAHLAEGISLALVTTFWGLLVAIPALVIAGVFRNRLEALTAQAISDSETLVPILRESLRNEKDYIRKLANKRESMMMQNKVSQQKIEQPEEAGNV